MEVVKSLRAFTLVRTSRSDQFIRIANFTITQDCQVTEISRSDSMQLSKTSNFDFCENPREKPISFQNELFGWAVMKGICPLFIVVG